LKDPAEAERLLRQAVESDPKSADAASRLDWCLWDRIAQVSPRVWLQRAILIDREYAGAINNLGVLYLKLGQTNDAIAAFRCGIEIAPG